jgi:RecG-like helicase
MIIESAERFIITVYQLRGRVGRGADQKLLYLDDES